MTQSAGAGLNVVSIGGGTGLATLLSGLKHHVFHHTETQISLLEPFIETLTAVVTVTDDGGSSGRLREEFQMLPPGDIRNCLVALAEDERLLTRLFRYRFDSDGDLSGHSFGNLFLTALSDVTGDFLEAIKLTSEVLAIKGRIFPSTMEDVSLVADLADGRTIEGETKIVNSRTRINRLRLSKPDCQPLPETLDAIKRADLITIGPGSLYTSLIPNLLVEGIVKAISETAGATVYVCNIMTQPGETDGFSVEDHIEALLEYSPLLRLDYVVVNSAPVSTASLDKYLADGATQVVQRTRGKLDLQRPLQTRLIAGDLVSDKDVVRHDPDKLAGLLLQKVARQPASRLAAEPSSQNRGS
ncbi:MAG TPA: YvcK family protein [Blastocatellia bacterium]|nr:YvcK family protein [Blastocatellia bacterium]